MTVTRAKHLANQIQHPELISDNTLHVVGIVTNPVRFHSRYRLAREWLDEMGQTPNVKPYLAEAAFGDRHHEVTSSQADHLQVRTRGECWIKENLINLGVRTLLPRDWKYVAWIDCDVTFRDPEWAQETLHQLQHWPVVQPWQQCADLGYLGDILQTHNSFGYMHATDRRIQRWSGEPYPYGHTGFAWAATRAFWEQTGGLLDFCILGSADHHMAWACIGECDSTIHQGMTPKFFQRIREWQDRATRITHREVGYVPGRIEHFFHGPKRRRYYKERWQILVDHKFDPDVDLVHDPQGVVQLAGNKPDLERALRKYNRSRFEDSIENE
jgi:hypothetical protein